MYGHDKKAMNAARERLRIAQRITLLVSFGALSADFFLRPSADIALSLNWAALVLLIIALLIQLVLMRRS